MAGSAPVSSNSDSEGEVLMLESPLSGSLSVNSLAAKAIYLFYLFFYFARKTLKDIYKHTYSIIHKIIHIYSK